MQRYKNEFEAVWNLQTYLRQLSYRDSEIMPPQITGIFDAATRQALCQFQKKRDLPVSGIADQTTWNALFAAYQQSVADCSLPAKISVFPPYPADYCLAEGSSGFCVLVLQYLLGELQYGMNDDIPVLQTGVFDEPTAQNVRSFQACCPELAETGTVDRATWNVLVARYNALFDRFPKE